LNVETAPANASLFVPGTTGVISSSGTSGTSPWTVPNFGSSTNGTGTTTGTTNSIVSTALRSGVGKVNFVRFDYNSLLGQFSSNSVSYVDTYITNGTQMHQTLVRALTAPDIMFDARDLVGADTSTTFIKTQAGIPTASFQNNDALNGATGNEGPGQIVPGLTIIFNKAGNALLNSTPAFLSEVNSSPNWIWGSFDGSTNAPVVYPSGTSISDLEQQVLSGHATGGISGTTSLVSPWMSEDQILFPPGTTISTGTTGTGTGIGTGVTGSTTP
jgi:hypothetical protein